jgi:hypothetical protein
MQNAAAVVTHRDLADIHSLTDGLPLGKTGGGTVGPAPDTNRQLNWLLAVYQDRDAKPGVIPSTATARKTTLDLIRRATLEAILIGVADSNTAEDAVGRMFLDLAEGKIRVKYERAAKHPRAYINTILRRGVQRGINKRRRDEGAPLPPQLVARTVDPAEEAAAKDTAEQCAALGVEPAIEMTRRRKGRATSAEYTQRHRERQRRWQRIAHLFPDMLLRPRAAQSH